MITDLLKNNLALAPLAGYTDIGFRALAFEYGCSLATTEMVSAKALEQNNAQSFELLKCLPGDGVTAVQLFGHDEEVFRKVVQSDAIQSFPIIDINMGCPVPKVVRNGDGSALMSNFNQASGVIKAVKTSGKYVTVKFRTGITDNSLAVDFAKMCEDSGADMLTVHGRTVKQMYSGRADWSTIAEVVNAVKIPVMANGDVIDKASYDEVTRQTACFGAAIGRGALGKPFIFAEILGKEYEFDLMSALLRHIDSLRMIYTERVVANEMKKHIAFYLKGYRGAKATLTQVQTATSVAQMTELVRNFLSGKSV